MSGEAMQTDAYRIVQGGHVVARVEGPHALREIMAEAGRYRQDGPLRIERRERKSWRAYGLMEVGNG